MNDILFTLLVFAAVLALFTRYAVIVLSATLLAVIWVMVDLFGTSLFLAILLMGLATLVRMAVMVGTGRFDSPDVIRLIDELLSRRQGPDQDQRDRQLQHRDTAQTDGSSIFDDRR